DICGRDDTDPAANGDRCVDLALAPDHDVLDHRSDAAADPLASLVSEYNAERERNIAAWHELPSRVGEGRLGAALAAVEAGGARDLERAILERGETGTTFEVDLVTADTSPPREPRGELGRGAAG